MGTAYSAVWVWLRLLLPLLLCTHPGSLLPVGGTAPTEAVVWWMAMDDATQQKYFSNVYSDAEWFARHGHGSLCVEAETILFTMRLSFTRQPRKPLLIDVGTNTGNALAAMISAFNEPGRGPVWVYAFEPNPDSFVQLKRGLAASGLSKHHRVHLIEAAVSDKIGRSTFFHRGAGDLLSGLSQHPDRHLMPNGEFEDRVVEVELVTLDSLFDRRTFVHLLKVDAEGHDPLVLRGARRLLSRFQIKFIVFEYDVAWREAGHGLLPRVVIEELRDLGYVCFLMTKAALLPVFGKWWLNAYETITWGNFFCGQERDHDLFDAYMAYGTNNYTLAFALTNLRSGSYNQLSQIH